MTNGGNLGLSREYHKKLFGPLFYTWWNCPLTSVTGKSFVPFCVFLKYQVRNVSQVEMFHSPLSLLPASGV